MKDEQYIGAWAYYACFLEVMTHKPGNVHPGQAFPMMAVRDFVRSATAIAPVMEDAPGRSVGRTILEAIRATRAVVTTNTNLGIVLLFAPLAAVPPGANVRERLPAILAALTVEDARDAYAAIRLAEPGGLGRVENQDVADEPTVTLLEAMAQATDRDLIAAQYVNDFAHVLAGVDWLAARLHGDQASRLACPGGINPPAHPGFEAAVVDLYLHLLSRHADSLVCRKRGDAEAEELRKLAAGVVEAPAAHRLPRLAELDNWFAAAFPHRNPGTTADLVAACLFVALREGIIQLPDTTGLIADTP